MWTASRSLSFNHRGHNFYNVQTSLNEADDDDRLDGAENEELVVLQDKGAFTCVACKDRDLSFDAPPEEPSGRGRRKKRGRRKNLRRGCRDKAAAASKQSRESLCGCWACDPTVERQDPIARLSSNAPCSGFFTTHQEVMAVIYPEDNDESGLYFEEDVILPPPE